MNRLAAETSPYLRQHAHDPVAWLPWGEDALVRARAEDCPILLSVGYSSCHWCHVMQRESFSDPETARLLNARFVCVKVDREERPDVDAMAMEAVVALTGRGGWPLTVFLTPEGVAYDGGTYYPAQPRAGLPALNEVAKAAADRWSAHREGVLHEVVHPIGPRSTPETRADSAVSPQSMLDGSVEALSAQFDPLHSGFGSAPKFPPITALEFLLARHVHRGDERALKMATRTLDAMAAGGIYDHLGGGFHRYASDAQWSIPHFEKMLCDNALLASLYLHAWAATGRARYRTVCEETLDYVLRELCLPDGGFASAQDAEAGGVDGGSYAWRRSEVVELLNAEELDAVVASYGVTRHGNHRGRNVLSLSGAVNDERTFARARAKLLAARARRPQPVRDEQVLAAWNGLAVAALAEAGWRLDRPDYVNVARTQAAFLLSELDDGRGGVYHACTDGIAKVPGFLDDYAAMALGLIEVFTATADPSWLDKAVALVDIAIDRFHDADTEVLRFDSREHDAPTGNPAPFEDRQLPAAAPLLATVQLRLARLLGEPGRTELVEHVLAQAGPWLESVHPRIGSLLFVVDNYHQPPREIAVVGALEEAGTQALRSVLQQWHDPAAAIAFSASNAVTTSVPLLQGKSLVKGRPAAYVCERFTCQAPLTEPEELRASLDQPR